MDKFTSGTPESEFPSSKVLKFPELQVSKFPSSERWLNAVRYLVRCVSIGTPGGAIPVIIGSYTLGVHTHLAQKV